MHQSPLSEVDNRSAVQGIIRLLRRLKFHCCVLTGPFNKLKRPSLQLPNLFNKTYFNIILSCRATSFIFSLYFRFMDRNFVCVCVCFIPHERYIFYQSITDDLISLIIFGELYKLCISYLWIFFSLVNCNEILRIYIK